MKSRPVTVLIHTLDEVDQIDDCLRSVEWADEIYLLDSFSTDDTVDLVRSKFPHVRVELHKSLGSAAQKNYGIDRASHDWILVVDADERVTPELREEILEILRSKSDCWAYDIKRQNYALGKRVRWGLLRWDSVIRLFHRRHARYPNKRVHAELDVDGPARTLKNPLVHHYVRSFPHMAERMDRYAYWSAAQMFLEDRPVNLFDIVIRPTWRFIREYLLLAGFLDGLLGLGVAVHHANYTFQKYLNLWELRRTAAAGIDPHLPEMESDEALWRRPWEDSSPGREGARAEPISDRA